jgi:uncharacterized membrane-anchored protein
MADEEKKSTVPPSSITTSRNTILMGAGAAVAVIVPTSINSIASPLVRSIMALVALGTVFGLGLFATPPKGKK